MEDYHTASISYEKLKLFQPKYSFCVNDEIFIYSFRKIIYQRSMK